MANDTIRVTGEENGIVRVWAPDASRDSRNAARRVAAESLGVKAGTLAFATDLGTAKGGHVLGVAKLTTRKAADPAPATSEPTDPRDVEIAKLRAELAKLTAKGSKGKAAPAPREVPAFLRGNPDAACKVCLDFGVVRAHGDNAGHAYKTANGAAEATRKGNSKPCEAKGCKAGRKAGEAA